MTTKRETYWEREREDISTILSHRVEYNAFMFRERVVIFVGASVESLNTMTGGQDRINISIISEYRNNDDST